MPLPTSSLSEGSSFAVLVNQGLDPGVRVFLDDRAEETATVCFCERGAPYARVRLDRSGKRIRVASWRLACVE